MLLETFAIQTLNDEKKNTDEQPLDVVNFNWESSHYWVLGDTLGYIYRRMCKHITQISDSFKKQYGVKK